MKSRLGSAEEAPPSSHNDGWTVDLSRNQKKADSDLRGFLLGFRRNIRPAASVKHTRKLHFLFLIRQSVV